MIQPIKSKLPLCLRCAGVDAGSYCVLGSSAIFNVIIQFNAQPTIHERAGTR